MKDVNKICDEIETEMSGERYETYEWRKGVYWALFEVKKRMSK